uniref:Putative secreted protein n=1 Tax=Anopheles darlingi TaxID=43151 RepID=A0A2M4DLD7_ANODA
MIEILFSWLFALLSMSTGINRGFLCSEASPPLPLRRHFFDDERAFDGKIKFENRNARSEIINDPFN